jgi:CheY-like chemotaxis protein/DNA-binding CsgD family transcriptional regulator
MEGKRILVVDDDRTTAKIIELQLQKMGYDVVSITKTAASALKLCKELSPDLVLMDVNLGKGMDGIEAADIINKKLDIPVIFVTAYADEQTLTRAKQTQPYGYINKPLREIDLRTTITLALERSESAEKVALSRLERKKPRTKMYIVLDSDGELVRANAAVNKFIKQLELEDVTDLLPEGNRKHVARARSSKKPQLLNGMLQDRVITWEYRIISSSDNVRLTLSDITEYRRLADRSIQEATLSEALDNLATGVIFINENLKVYYLNKSARQLLDREEVLQLNEDYLNCATPAYTAELHKCIAQGVPHTLSLERGETQSPLRILVTPLVSRDANYGQDRPIAIIYTFETVNSPERIEDVLHSFYSLSPAESKIVSRLIHSPRLEDVATELGITLNTARTHMKRIYSKTNARGMSALLNMIVTGPAGTLIHSDE